ncbi:AAA family ATPase [Dongshaea marina]|uniref:AAA family ATPase n=1 Tax=Dongshaea marina TaxID=2047966 RepID=UPI000D3E106C|nr:AAA family ATPase [Dongshaea marina]
MIRELKIQGYRSIRKLSISLGRINVIQGPNGCGKSNLYHSVRLLAQTVEGNLPGMLAAEGGLSQAMWAGGLRRGDRKGDPKRVILSAQTEQFGFELQLGLPTPNPMSLFSLDPEIKEETLWLTDSCRPSTTILKRRNQSARLRNIQGEQVQYNATLLQTESVFSHLAEPHLYPEVSEVRETLRRWRFYHQFPTHAEAAVRWPQVGTRTTVLSDDGRDLAAAFATIEEIGDSELLHECLSEAFPGSRFGVRLEGGRFEVLMHKQGLIRPLGTAEMSDGTLRFLCLTVALLTPRPPGLMALNEPETSLHPSLLPALGRLISLAGRWSQLWITTHSEGLANAIERHSPCHRIALEMRDGETRLREQAMASVSYDPTNRCWSFDGE